MNLQTLIVILGAFALGTALIAFVIAPLRRRMKEYVKKVSVCGYLGPKPEMRHVKHFLRFARLLSFWQVGRVKVEGKENIDLAKPVIVSANHAHYIDVAIMPVILNRPARYMVHESVFFSLFGLGAYLGPKLGCFVAHDQIKDNGARARAAAVKVLSAGEVLVLFPEGLTSMSPELLPVKHGAVKIIKQTLAETGKDAYIVPAYMRYGKYPGQWIQKYPRPVQYLFTFLLAPWYRRGARVVFGKPIAASELPADDSKATDILRDRIIALDPKSV